MVFLNGYHIDQVYRVDYRENSQKVPIYGYNDIHYTKAVQSKVLIQGMLVTNFVFSAYLNRAVIDRGKNLSFVPKLYNYGFYGKSKDTAETAMKENLKRGFKSEMPSSSLETREARAEYIANLLSKPSERKRTKEALNKFFSVQPEREANVPLSLEDTISINEQSINLPSTKPDIDTNSMLLLDGTLPYGSTIDVYYQDPRFVTWFQRFSNVYFNDVSQQISQAGAEGSAEPLYEIYSFMASKRETIKIK